MLDKAFYEEEVRRLCLAFEQQVCFHIRFLSSGCNTLKIMPNTNRMVCSNLSIAVPLRGVLCLHEVEGAGDQELDVDIGMCCAESEVEDPRQCCLHVLRSGKKLRDTY